MKNKSVYLSLLFVLLAFLWGGSFVAIKEAIAIFDSWFSASLRLVVALLILILIFSFQSTPLRLKPSLRWKIWVTGLFTMGIPFSLLFWGEHYVSAGLAGMTNGTTPLWTAFLAAAFSPTERAALKSPGMILGLVLGFVGIILLFAPLVSTEDLKEVYGALAVMAMAICYAVGNVLNRHFLSGKNAVPLGCSIFHQHISSFVYLLIGLVLFGSFPNEINWQSQWPAWLAIVYMGSFSTAFALLIYFYLIKTWGAVKTSSVTYLVPLFAVLLDFVFYGTRPGFTSLFGVGLVLLGVFFVRSAKPLQSSPSEDQPDDNKGDAQKLAHA